MKILHIANLTNDKTNGVNIVVPKHVEYQQVLTEVALCNLLPNEYNCPKEINNYFYVQDKNVLDAINAPFNMPDLVIFHGIYYLKYVALYKILLKRNIPYVVVPHGSLVKNAVKSHAIKKYAAHILLFNRYIKNAAAVQFLSKGERDSSYFAKKGIILPNGINYFPLVKRQFDEEIKGLDILFIGRKNIITKGLDFLLNAVVALKHNLLDNNVKIKLYGPNRGNGDKFLNEEIAKYGLQDIVQNLGSIFEKEKEEAFLKSHIFILTSRNEGLPTAVLEAMSYGIPVLVTRGTSMYDDVKTFGCGWVAENNAESIAVQLNKLMAEKDKIKQYGENAYKYVKANYEWENIAEKTISSYKKLVVRDNK